jgi:hypothetical protein
MGVMINGDFGTGIEETPVPKKRLAAMLGCSPRWLELRVRDGLPSAMVRGRRFFVPSEARAWITANAPNSPIAKQIAAAQSPPGKPAAEAPKAQGPASGPAPPGAPAPTNTPTAEDHSRAEAIAALEQAIRGLQQQLAALKGETTPAA